MQAAQMLVFVGNRQEHEHVEICQEFVTRSVKRNVMKKW